MGSLHYKNFTISKDRPLGRGSFGAVYKAWCDELPCAAKVLHPMLIDPSDSGAERIRQRFEQECRFMDSIRHPNIVLYLGVTIDPETRLPVLLMELLDESLTSMLEQSPNPLPFHIQVDICHDVSLALSYLHSQSITHRDLSSNNVLMVAKRRAKVADFGMSRILDIDRRNSTQLTMCPGTKVYMPPEALKDPPHYSNKLDVFSLGVIVIQVLTRLYPSPTSLTQEVRDQHHAHRRLQMIISEVDRRRDHINLIDPNNPLRETAVSCLENEDYKRPEASYLCRTFAGLKQLHAYMESKQNDDIFDTLPGVHALNVYGANGRSQSSELKKKLYEKEKQVSQMRSHLSKQEDFSKLHLQGTEKKKAELAKYLQESQQLEDKEGSASESKPGSQSLVEEQRRKIMKKDLQIQDLTRRLKENEQITADFQKIVQDLQKRLLQQQATITLSSPTVSSPTASFPTVSSPTVSSHQSLGRQQNSEEKLEMMWRSIESAPTSLHRGTSAFHDGMVYLAFKSKVFVYSTTSLHWKGLPDSPQANGGFVTINEFPTMIGGEANGSVTNSLVSLVGDTNECNWMETFTEMPTARVFSAAVVCNNHLIVAGGSSSTRLGEDILPVVEVMEIGELECPWFSVSSLHHPLADASAVVHQGHLMLIGGTDYFGKTLTNLKCSIRELLNTKTKRHANKEQDLQHPPASKITSSVWKQLADSRLLYSTGVVVNGNLLAIGGSSADGVSGANMYRYDDISMSWEQVGLMRTARSLCYAVSLPGSELMVVGGCKNTSSPYTLTDRAEIATIS